MGGWYRRPRCAAAGAMLSGWPPARCGGIGFVHVWGVRCEFATALRSGDCAAEVRREGGGCASGERAGGLRYAEVLRAENQREALVRELGRAPDHGAFLRSGDLRRIERSPDSFERGGTVISRIEDGRERARVVAMNAVDRGHGDERVLGPRENVHRRAMTGRLDLLG